MSFSQKKRLEICNSCSSSQWTFGAGLTCGPFMRPQKGDEPTCGCKLTWKTSLPKSKCPQNKW